MHQLSHKDTSDSEPTVLNNSLTDNQSYSDSRKQHTSSEERMVGFQKFVRRYEINNNFTSRLQNLDGYEIVVICDDSGSMNAELCDISGPYNKTPTRWDELKQTISIIVDLASVLDPDGVDVYFLNREPLLNVRSSEELIPIFSIPPEGPTPIVRVLREILQNKKKEIETRKLLILLATDGAPTDDEGYVKIDLLRYVLEHERTPIDQIPVTIIACTDDAECVSYLNDWDKNIPNLDVCDDYRTEKKEILICQGKTFPFSFGDYVVKILLGGIDDWFDQLNEKRVLTDEYGRMETTTIYTNTRF